MFIIAAMFAIVMMVGFASGQNILGFFLFAVVMGFIFAGFSERGSRKKAPDLTLNSLTSNIFFDHPMVEDILMMIENTGCCESISFEPETALRCERRKICDGDENVTYYDFRIGERKYTLTLDEQCELLKLIKHYLPNGETYRIQAAYDKNEYEALQKTAEIEFFYSDGRKIRNPSYGREVLPVQPKYYMMYTNFYQNKRWNADCRRWEMPIMIFKPVVDAEHKAV